VPATTAACRPGRSSRASARRRSRHAVGVPRRCWRRAGRRGHHRAHARVPLRGRTHRRRLAVGRGRPE
jgi:hypothetical protein